MPPNSRVMTEPEGTLSKRPKWGHFNKIEEVVLELIAEGALPPHLRPMDRNKRIGDRLVARGYRKDQPSRRALNRAWSRLKRLQHQSAHCARPSD
jgi:hypothetical protein